MAVRIDTSRGITFHECLVALKKHPTKALKIFHLCISSKSASELLRENAKLGDRFCVQFLLGRMSEKRQILSPQTAVEIGASLRDLEMIKWAVENGLELDLQEPLRLAAKFGHVDVVEFLLEKGATSTKEVFEAAVENRQFFVIAYLGERDPSLFDQLRMGSLLKSAVFDAACRKGYVSVVEKLSPEFYLLKGSSGGTALHTCAQRDYHVNIAKWIKGKWKEDSTITQNVNTLDGRKKTALFYAKENCHDLGRELQEVTAEKLGDDEEYGRHVSGIQYSDKLSPFFDAKEKLKNIGHVLDISGNVYAYNEEIALGGAAAEVQASLFLKAKTTFEYPELAVALDRSYSAFLSDEDLAERVQKGKLTILNSGWLDEESGHSIRVVFYDDLMAICNTGEGAGFDKGPKHFEVYRIDPSKVTKDIVYEIRHNRKPSRIQYRYIYRTMLDQIKAKKDDDCLYLERYNQEPQEGGTCTYAGLKSAVRFALMVLTKTDGEEPAKKIDHEIKANAFKDLESLMKKPDANVQIPKRLYHKIWSHWKRWEEEQMHRAAKAR